MKASRKCLLLLDRCAIAAYEREDAIQTTNSASDVVPNHGNGIEPVTLDLQRNEDDRAPIFSVISMNGNPSNHLRIERDEQ